MGKGSWVAAIVAGLVLLALPAAAGKIKRFTDDEGTLHIVDSEPGEAKAGPGAATSVSRPHSFPAPGGSSPVAPSPAAIQPSPVPSPTAEAPVVQPPPPPPPEPEPEPEDEGGDGPEESASD